MTTLKDPEKGQRLAVPRRQPARLRGAARRPGRVQAVRPHRQLPQHPGDRPRGPQEVQGRDRARDQRPGRAARSSCSIVDDPIETVQRKVVHLIEKEEVPPQDIVVLSAHNREESEVGRGRAARRVLLRRQARAARPVRAVLLDPRLQGPRVAGRDPLRARGPRRGDPTTSSSTSGCRGPRITASWSCQRRNLDVVAPGYADSMSTSVWTIGHSNHSLERFVELLRSQSIDFAIDVRSYPYSRYAPHFDREALEAALPRNGRAIPVSGRLAGRPTAGRGSLRRRWPRALRRDGGAAEF